MHNYLQSSSSNAFGSGILYVDATGQHVAPKSEVVEFIGHRLIKICE